MQEIFKGPHPVFSLEAKPRMLERKKERDPRRAEPKLEAVTGSPARLGRNYSEKAVRPLLRGLAPHSPVCGPPAPATPTRTGPVAPAMGAAQRRPALCAPGLFSSPAEFGRCPLSAPRGWEEAGSKEALFYYSQKASGEKQSRWLPGEQPSQAAAWLLGRG